MGGRASSRPTMSLLAFQDIITSVSGILMFIVLMLSLELSNDAPTAEPVAETAAEVARLEALIASARDNLERLERGLVADDDVARAAAAIAPDELRSDLRALDQRIAGLQATIAGLETRRDSLLADQKAEESLHSAAAGADYAATQKALQQAAQLASELEETQSDDRPVFTLPRGFNKSGWLVVISEDRCEVAPLGRRDAPRTFRVASGGFLSDGPDVSSFLDWARSKGADQYFLLVSRPSGAQAFKAIQKRFESDGVAFGFDLAGPRRKLLDPKRGADQ